MRRLPVSFVLLPCLLLACEQREGLSIELQLGASEPFQFQPRTAFAQYYELVGQPDQLRITLASYETGCENYQPPSRGEAYITVVVRVPTGQNIEPGGYPWKGSVEAVKEGQEASALPFVRLGEEGRPLPGGGEVLIESLDRTVDGVVQGTLKFQSGGSGEPSTAALRGPFRARICEVSLDPSRAQPDD